jgi:hypothetical protein
MRLEIGTLIATLVAPSVGSSQRYSVTSVSGKIRKTELISSSKGDS